MSSYDEAIAAIISEAADDNYLVGRDTWAFK
jgi:hypothetical protein